MLIYMIRHGQTDWNAEGRLQGQKDIGLNDTGRAQARLNGHTLRGLLGAEAPLFDYVSSPLGRTRETMQLARSEMGLDPLAYRTDDRLVELSFGDWEGHTLDEIRAVSPDRLKARSRQKWSFIPPGVDAEATRSCHGVSVLGCRPCLSPPSASPMAAWCGLSSNWLVAGMRWKRPNATFRKIAY